MKLKHMEKKNRAEIRYYDPKGDEENGRLILRVHVRLSDEELDYIMKLREQGMCEQDAYEEVKKKFGIKPMP
jgi:hypothetical protein